MNDGSLVAYFFSSKVSRFGEDLQILTAFLSLSLTLVLCFLKRDKLRKLLHVLIKIDKNISLLGAQINYKWLSRIIMITLGVAWLIFALFIGATFRMTRSIQFQPDLLEWLFFFLPTAIVSTLKVQFYCMMQLIKYRLRYVSLVLSHLHEEETRGTPLEHTSEVKIYECGGIACDLNQFKCDAGMIQDKCGIIAKLCLVHEELCDACYLAEEYFSYQMLTTVTIDFIGILFNVYFLLDVGYKNTVIEDVDHVEFMAYFIVYTVIMIGTVFAQLKSAESVTAEVYSVNGCLGNL